MTLTTNVPVARVVERDERLFLHSITAPQAPGTAAQLAAVMEEARRQLAAVGAAPGDIRKMVVTLADGADRGIVSAGLAACFPAGLPCLSVFVASGLSDPAALVEVDIDAVRGAGPSHVVAAPHSRGACTVARVGDEIFLSAIDGVDCANPGTRSAEEAADQAARAMERLAEALAAASASPEDVCKITVHVPDRAWREAVYPQIGRLLGAIYPVSTGLVVQGLGHPDALFAIDVLAQAGNGRPHRRERKYHTSTTRYGGMKQALDCGFCMSIRAGDRVFLRGQTAMDLDGVMRGSNDITAQSEQAMENVATLLADVGASHADVVKATLFVTDPDYLEPARAVVARHLKESAPAFAAVTVKGLAAPDLLMEVDILAICT